MYLKRLDLSGFKTFADESKLIFGPGITAIVGPNGSGKSNLADAILWVLGERSMKQLRGSRPADLIFTGNGQRKPVGMAEVSLTLDNTDGALGIDFSEVTVTRRVFRSGESQYLINKSPCRLRDIHELFLDTGLGPDAYSIITQSEIDAILSLRAEDRRALFEEVAGIQKYRFKRHETRLKLDRTERNLTRVRDLLYELENELGPLGRQAELAREYETYQDRLKALQLGLLAREYDARLKRRDRLTEERHQCRLQIDEALAAVAGLEAAADELDVRLLEREKEIVRIQRETTRLVSQVKSTEGKIAVSEERAKALTERRAAALAASQELTRQLEALQRDLQAAREQETGLRAEGIRLEQETLAKERRLAELDADIHREAGNLDLHKEEYLELMRKTAEKRNAIAACEATIRGLTSQVAAAEQALADAHTDLATLTTAHEEAKQALATVRARLAEERQHLDAARTALTVLERDREEATERAARLREELSERRSRLRVLNEMEAGMEGVAAAVRTVLNARDTGELTGICGTVAELVRVPREYEPAVEAALGPALQAILVETTAAAEAAIELLTRRRAGRAMFLPLDALQPAPRDASLRDRIYRPGGVGLALDLVRFPARYRRAFQVLLGRTVVFRDLRWIDRTPRPEAHAASPAASTLVTLAGEVVSPGGGRIGGRGGAEQTSLLSRRREIDELTGQVKGLSDRLAARTAYLDSLTERLGAARDTVTDLDRRTAEVAEEAVRQERNTSHLAEQVRRSGGAVKHFQEELQSLQSEIEGTREAAAGHESELARLEKTRRELDAAILAGQSALDEKREARELAVRAVNDSRVRFASVRERLVGAEKTRGALEQRERQIRETRVRNREIVAAAEQELSFLRKAVETDKARLEALSHQQDETEQSFQRWREIRRETLEEQTRVATRLREQRSALHTLEDDLHRVELRLTQTETEIEDLERRFVEEHGLQPEHARGHKDDLENKAAAEAEVQALKEKMTNLGEVNLGAIAEYARKQERYEFLRGQVGDLEEAKAKCEEIIAEIDANTKAQFMATFDAVEKEFGELFVRVFDGGSARLLLTDPTNVLETGIDIRVRPPGKVEQDLRLLSGGERALTALTLLLAMLRVKPSPFCVLDEIDAPLDETNVGKFIELLREFARHSQFILITHNKATMEVADVLYGVTMQKAGVSKLISLRLEEALAAATESRSPTAP